MLKPETDSEPSDLEIDQQADMETESYDNDAEQLVQGGDVASEEAEDPESDTFEDSDYEPFDVLPDLVEDTYETPSLDSDSQALFEAEFYDVDAGQMLEDGSEPEDDSEDTGTSDTDIELQQLEQGALTESEDPPPEYDEENVHENELETSEPDSNFMEEEDVAATEPRLDYELYEAELETLSGGHQSLPPGEPADLLGEVSWHKVHSTPPGVWNE